MILRSVKCFQLLARFNHRVGKAANASRSPTDPAARREADLGAALPATQELEDGAPVVCIVEAQNHPWALHHRGWTREVDLQHLGRPGATGAGQGGRGVEVFDADGRVADHALQVRTDAVPGGRDLIAGPTAPPKQVLSGGSIRRLGNRRIQ
jgi:hypothetical protein